MRKVFWKGSIPNVNIYILIVTYLLFNYTAGVCNLYAPQHVGLNLLFISSPQERFL